MRHPLPLVCALACIAATPLKAQSTADFYRGKTVTIVVGTSPGGGYDAYARLLGRYLAKHIPGAPSVIINNMPGAGSNIAAGYVAAVAPKDGTYIAAPFAAQPLGPILDDTITLKYNPSAVHYLGTAMSDVFLCIVRPNAPATTFKDMFNTEVVMGGTAESGSTGYLPLVLDNVLGTKFKVVFGYPGTREITMAIEKGEVQGMCGMNWTSMASQYADLLKTNAVKIIVQEHDVGQPELNQQGVPLTPSFAKSDEQRKILDIIYSQETFARPYFVAPEVPAARVNELRDAFMATWRDPELLQDAARMNLDVGATSGPEVQTILSKIYAEPPELLRAAKAAIKLRR